MSETRDRRPRRGPPVDVPPGFRWMYTRGYDLAAPASFAFQWMVAHAPPRGGGPPGTGHLLDLPHRPPEPRVERRRYPEHGTERVTTWELVPPDRVTFRDDVYRNDRLVVQGEERYRFLGGDGPGCIVEVTALRKPIGWLSRIGFAMFPEWSVRPRGEEAGLLRQIEQDHRRGLTSAVAPAEPH